MCYLLISEDSNIIERCRVNKVKLYSVRGIKATTLVQRVLNVPPILKNRIMCLDHRKWNILAFRGRLMSLLELRSVGLIEASLPTGVSHIPFAGLGIPKIGRASCRECVEM